MSDKKNKRRKGAAPTPPGLAARLGAARLLKGVLLDQQHLGDLSGPMLEGLEPSERARATSLADLVLRYLPKLDAVLSPFTERRPPALAQNALRIAAAEMLLDNIPAHAAVDGAVMLVRASSKTAHLKGLVNAVSRRVDNEGRAAWEELDPPGLPAPMKARIAKVYGKAAVPGIEAAHLAGAPFDLTAKDDPETLGKKLEADLLPSGSLRLKGRVQISAVPGFEDGDWWVQDAAAAIPARLLDVTDQDKVLDLCAAPGGKTLQLASSGAAVTALDLSEARLLRLRENLERCKLKAEVVAADVLTWEPSAPFDAILVDAPCSATGTIRRHPDLPHLRPNPDLRPLLALQAEMLDRAASWLKPGGRMVYCTCSLLPEEGERQADSFLERNSGFSRIEIPFEKHGLDPDWLTKAGDLRLRPDYWADNGGMDGFFVTYLQKA